MKHLSRYGILVALVLLIVAFSVASPTFLTYANLRSVLLNHVAILTLVSLGMTLVVASGGIDLSIGTAVDMGSLAFIAVLAANADPVLAIVAGLLAAAAVGVFNSFLISALRVPAFLATLGTLFIGQSVQQLFTNGGTPIYLIAGPPRPIFGEVDAARLWLVGAGLAATALIYGATAFGRRVQAIGIAPNVARYSGLPLGRDLSSVMILAAVLAGVAGIILASSVRSYAPLSGNAYLMDAIGATFLGTTFSTQGRANVLGTLIGVMLLGIVKNGLLLIGLSFYWQQVANGTLILAVLAVSFATRRAG